MLVIRLARTGRRNQPKFRVAVAEHSKPVNGKVVEVVGHFNPTIKKDPLVINKEAIESWISKGAQPSNTVSRLLNQHAGFDLEVKQRPPRKPKKEAEEKKPEVFASADEKVEEPASSEDDSGKESKSEETTEKPVKNDKPPSTSDDATSTDKQLDGQAGGAGKEETTEDKPTEEVKEEAPAEIPAEEKAEESVPVDAGSDEAPKDEKTE